MQPSAPKRPSPLRRGARATLRARARAAAERCLAAALPPLWVKRHQQDALILAYHNVVPPFEVPAGDRSLHLPQAAFAAQLDALARTHDVVPLADLLRPAPRRSRPRAAITFDDAYRGALTAGLAELAARNLPATFFVVTSRVGGGAFWWDVFASDSEGALPPRLRARALDEARGEDGAVRALAREMGIGESRVAAHALPAGEDELRAAAGVDGITFGSHTATHPNLARLGDDEVRAELASSLAWLGDRFADRATPWLSYPYGLSSPAVERAAAEAGYAGALGICGGFARAGRVRPFAVPRLNVPAGVSPAGFALRAAGVIAR